MKKHIVIVEILSTGFNYVEDVLARGYQPVVVEAMYPGTEEDRAIFQEAQEMARQRLPEGIPCIKANKDYNVILEQVRAYDPVIVVAGSEFGVELATRLSSDLGLLGNPWSIIGKMTRKNEMQQALADYGIRYIRGRIIRSEAEAEAFYQELDTKHTVIKRARGSGTLGLHFCEGYDELMDAVHAELAQSENDENVGDILMQERIVGREYIVNTVSCAGKHRLVSMCFYDKLQMNGSNIYNYMETVNRLDVGNSAIVRYAYDVLDAIGIQYGPVHGEYMVDEKGPVLIEVNCRPMGAGQTRQYLEKIFGQHETDSALDAYLDPVKFEQERLKPYRPLRKGMIKSFILPNDVTLESAPVLQLVRQLPSYFYSVFERLGRDPFLSHTRDLETTGGMVYLVHDDERVVKEDCAFLHMLEMKYPEMLFNQLKPETSIHAPRIPLDVLMKETDCHGSTLVFSDTETEAPDAVVIDSKGLSSAYDCYNNILLDLSRPETFADMESVSQQIFMFLSKVREGGRVLVPESTYCHLPYGAAGMEILLRAHGLRIEVPLAGKGRLLIASA
ncbi:MAG: ATP-grasp domain-containing protein [Prevotella sp.]|nr:ATP-grasp domain-containing protein [Prevotella sp.]